MQGFSPKLPLTIDKTEGFYLMNRTAVDSIKQDLKMLVLTSPGERMMMPEYGVGIRKVIFEQNSDTTKTNLINKIRNQAREYMSFIKINDIQIETNEVDENTINVSIYYEIPSAGVIDEIALSLTR